MHIEVDARMVYAYTGGRAFDPTLPVIVFIHGAENDHSVWGLQSRYFAHHGASVLALDLPGHGRSEGPPLASIAALAGWISELLDAAEVSTASLVGHSMGSLVALETATRVPRRAHKIALLGSAIPMPVSELLLDAARDDEPRAMEMINIWSHAPQAQIGGNTLPGIWMMGANRALMQRQVRGVLHNDLAACNDYTLDPERPGRIACPALLVVGSRDQMTPPRASKALAATLPNAHIVMLEGAGHALMSEQPDAVLDALRSFLLN